MRISLEECAAGFSGIPSADCIPIGCAGQSSCSDFPSNFILALAAGSAFDCQAPLAGLWPWMSLDMAGSWVTGLRAWDKTGVGVVGHVADTSSLTMFCFGYLTNESEGCRVDRGKQCKLLKTKKPGASILHKSDVKNHTSANAVMPEDIVPFIHRIMLLMSR